MILDRFKLDGKIAIVTGTSRGLGQAIAVGLAEAGADLALVHRSAGAETEERILALGRRAITIRADLAESGAAAAIVAETVERLGGIDILVNNAGIIRRAAVTDFTEQDWDEVMNVNLRSLFFLSQAAAKVMIAQGRGGKIVNVASMLSFQGGIRVASYTASKSAVLGLTRLLANELAAHGINVNAIAPGYMETENTAPLRADKARNQAILDRIPAGRWGAPEDLQGAAVFLASAAAQYLHGYAIAVDGGWLAR